MNRTSKSSFLSDISLVIRDAVGRHGSGRVRAITSGSMGNMGRHLSKYPWVTGSTGNCPSLVRGGLRVGSQRSGNLLKI